jgi:hypothetical protein
MQLAADASLSFGKKLARVAADVARPSGTFARHSKDLLHVCAPDILRRNMQAEFSELLPCLDEIHSDRTEIGGGAFDDRDPTGSNPDVHPRIVASVRGVVTVPNVCGQQRTRRGLLPAKTGRPLESLYPLTRLRHWWRNSTP